MRCMLCNDHIEDIDFQFGEVREIEGEYWHADCFAEYYEEALDQV